jgi:transcriptional regulator with XRE-family HTH domain
MADEKALAEKIGAQVRTLREKAGLSTRELARQAGISQPFLSQVERGVSAPSMVTTYRLADALGVLPGALLPVPDTSMPTVLRAAEGRMLPVADRPDAAVGRILLQQPDNPLDVIEYRISPGEYLQEWFELEGDLALFVVAGTLDVEVEGAGTYRVGPSDLLSHKASLPHRWFLVGDEPAHVLLMLAHPPG